MEDMGTESELLELAEVRFGKLTAVDKKLFTAVAKGEYADYQSGNDESDKPENADKWPARRVIKAEQIQWLCTDPKTKKLVTHKGIQIIGARIEGELDLGYVEISFPLFFFKCAFKKTIFLQHAQIRALNLGGTHTGPVKADGLIVKGGVFLRNGFKAEGEVRLTGATIDEDLSCTKGEFINPDGNALFAERLNVKGSVYLRYEFKAEGAVRLLSTNIDGDLDCEKGEFINPTKNAFLAERLNVKGGVFLRKGFKAEGLVSLAGARINGHLVWTGVKSPEKAGLDLRSAKIGTLWDERKSWPDEGELYLNGLVYDYLDDGAPKDKDSRIEWLRLQGGDEFTPQPYEQLAEVLKKSGHEETAKEILIAKNKDRIRLGPKLTKIEWWRYKVFGPMIGYGYRPWDVFWKGPFGKRFVGSIIFWLVLGWLFFGAGYYCELFSPTTGWAYDSGTGQINSKLKDEYPAFNFLVYSIDTFVPLVDLHQTKYWLPNPNKGIWQCPWKIGRIGLTWIRIDFGGLLRLYLWMHISAGWILTTLLVVGFTGLIRT